MLLQISFLPEFLIINNSLHLKGKSYFVTIFFYVHVFEILKKLAKWFWRIQKLKKLYRLIDTVNDEKKSEKSFVNEYKVVQ